jgi:acyl-CoA reductase-like NAD-dependent aldehyde dehydrogenase
MDIQAEFIGHLSARVAALRTGDPLLPETDVGPLIHPRETDRITCWIEEAIGAGARLIGGGRLSATTLKPAILVNPPISAKVSQLEVFGPLTCVYGFQELDQAIDAANALPVAFQASVFSTELAPAMRAAQRLDASAVMINDHTAFRVDWMPFTGRHQSGYGIGGIPWTMKEMAQEKMVVLRHA